MKKKKKKKTLTKTLVSVCVLYRLIDNEEAAADPSSKIICANVILSLLPPATIDWAIMTLYEADSGEESKNNYYNNKKTIKFHGDAVENVVVILQSQRGADPSSAEKIKTFDAARDPLVCETINIQVVSDYVTITFYRQEQANSIIRRELIPSHRVERILIEDLKH